MERIKVLLIGAGGYGNVYVNFFKDGLAGGNAVLAGVADPFAKTSPGYEWFGHNGIPVYESPGGFFKERSAGLTVIAAPTALHAPYSILAMENGSHVLCEKPITSTVQELDALAAEQKRLGMSLGVGFQWSFSETITAIKRDILSGVYGQPKLLKTMISWPRPFSYYNSSGWKGRVADGKGHYILDSVVTNAAAHYLHNIFFLLGGGMGQSACPDDFSAELYRAKDIESFDTCFIKGRISGGEFFYAASHATDTNENPRFRYEFEKGVIYFNEGEKNNTAVGVLSDGTRIVYGNPFTRQEEARKLTVMLECAGSDSPALCSIETVRPHMLVCNALFEFGHVDSFPPEMLARTPENVHASGLYGDLVSCYKAAVLPSEKGLSWSGRPVSISLGGYSRFGGCVFFNKEDKR